MGKYERMREIIMKTPTANDISPEKLQAFLKHYGFELKRVTGSHFIYAYKGSQKEFMLNIPMHSPVKPAYIDMIRDQIVKIEEENHGQL